MTKTEAVPYTAEHHRAPCGRFAPSPSGRMHLGNLYTALAAWLCAKSRGGTFLLRMEDLDPMRCPRSFADLILSDLEWLGLSWDNATVPYQSERGAIYTWYFDRLQQEGQLYPCFCSRAQLHVADAPPTPATAASSTPARAGT